jgi:uncharacterized protein
MTKPPYPEIEALSRLELLSAMGITAVVLALLAKACLYFGQLQLPNFRCDLESVGIGLALGLMISALSYLTYRYWPAYRENTDWFLNFTVQPLAWPDLLWLGLLPGLSEELLFRGVILPSIGYDWLGVLLSAVCFGLLHASGRQQWPYALWACFMGVVLGAMLLQTNNLMVPIAAHISCNICSACFWKWQKFR